MWLRRTLESVWLVGTLAVSACGDSSGGRRDQNYGKDVGTIYRPPEGNLDAAAVPDGSTETLKETSDGDSGAVGETAPTDAQAIDVGG